MDEAPHTATATGENTPTNPTPSSSVIDLQEPSDSMETQDFAEIIRKNISEGMAAEISTSCSKTDVESSSPSGLIIFVTISFIVFFKLEASEEIPPSPCQHFVSL